MILLSKKGANGSLRNARLACFITILREVARKACVKTERRRVWLNTSVLKKHENCLDSGLFFRQASPAHGVKRRKASYTSRRFLTFVYARILAVKIVR